MAKLLDKLEIGANTAPPAAAKGDRSSAFSKFWQATKGNGWNMVKINLLTLLFFVPMVAWIIWMSFQQSADGYMLPYSANIGIGLPVVTDAVSWGMSRAFAFSVRRWLVMIPLIMIGSIGLAGALYSMKYMYRKEGKLTLKIFFRGIKKCWLPFFVLSVPAALAIFSLAYNIGAIDNVPSLHISLKVIGIIASVLLLLITLVVTVFATTQSATYKLKARENLKNSFLFALALLPRTVVVLAICAVPVVLVMLLSGFLSTFVLMFFLLVGFSFIALALTVYSQWAFDKYINPRLAKAEREATPSRKQRKRMEAAKRKAEQNAGENVE